MKNGFVISNSAVIIKMCFSTTLNTIWFVTLVKNIETAANDEQWTDVDIFPFLSRTFQYQKNINSEMTNYFELNELKRT